MENSLKDRLLFARAKRQLNQSDFADLLGVRFGTYQRAESGRKVSKKNTAFLEYRLSEIEKEV